MYRQHLCQRENLHIHFGYMDFLENQAYICIDNQYSHLLSWHPSMCYWCWHMHIQRCSEMPLGKLDWQRPIAQMQIPESQYRVQVPSVHAFHRYPACHLRCLQCSWVRHWHLYTLHDIDRLVGGLMSTCSCSWAEIASLQNSLLLDRMEMEHWCSHSVEGSLPFVGPDYILFSKWKSRASWVKWLQI